MRGKSKKADFTPEEYARKLERNRGYSRKKKVETPEEAEARKVRNREKGKATRARHREKRIQAAREYRVKNRERLSAYNKARWAKLKAGKSVQVAIGEALNEALGKNHLYHNAQNAVSSRLPPHVRDDVISEIILAVLEGDLAEADISKHAGKFLAAHYKMHPTKFGPISLDAPAYRDGGRDTIGDTISEGMWT